MDEQSKKGVADRTALNEWWTDRSTPTSRSGVREALEVLEITSTKLLLVRCYGLSFRISIGSVRKVPA